MFEILYQDTDLVAVNKPENLLCVPGLCADDNLFDRVRRPFPNARVVHRLDMATSGVVLFALNHTSQKHLGRQFERRQIHKQYAALVQGEVTAQWGEVVLPLLCDWPNRPKQKVEWRNGKNAHTCFQVVARFPHHSHLRLYPVTGRSHQLRVHCLHLGHPIIGDTLYNNASTADRLMLHAERIVFQHPQTGGKIELYSPAPFATYNNLSNSAAICC